MVQVVVSVLAIATGLVAAGAGVAVATHRLQVAHRLHQRTTACSADTAEEWGGWFLSGFAGLSMGTRWLLALAVWLAWTVAGAALMGLGFRLFLRA